MDVLFWAELRTATHRAQGLHLLWHRIQTAILKDEEDTGVNSLAFTQDMHRHGAVPVGKKATTLLGPLGNLWTFTPVNC